MRVRCAAPKPHTFWHCVFKTHPNEVSKDGFGGMFSAEVFAFRAPYQKHTLFGIAQLKHSKTKCLKTPRLAFLVYAYVRSGRHTKNTHGMALCISNTPILGIQRHSC